MDIDSFYKDSKTPKKEELIPVQVHEIKKNNDIEH
jgi:hypothetical protein